MDNAIFCMDVICWFLCRLSQGKDISVDFLVVRLDTTALRIPQVAVPLLIIILMLIMLAQMPTILSSQVGVIDGVVTPWGELERYTLSIPLGVSCFLILINSTVTLTSWSEAYSYSQQKSLR